MIIGAKEDSPFKTCLEERQAVGWRRGTKVDSQVSSWYRRVVGDAGSLAWEHRG